MYSPKKGNYFVRKYVDTLERLATPMELNFVWVPRHNKVSGKEKADELA